MYNIKICKYYKHPKTCTNPNGCIEQLISNPQFCCSKLYYSMGLEEVNENYKHALDEIRQSRIAEINDEEEEKNDTVLNIIRDLEDED